MARRVNWTDAAVLFVATLAASTAFADEDGFVDDWHGNMTILTKSSLGSSFEDIPSLVTNIRTTFDTAAKNINVCEQLKYAVMKGRRGVTWRGCKAPDNVDRELRVKPGLNLIKLKYIFPQAHIIFDTLSIGFPPSYTV